MSPQEPFRTGTKQPFLRISWLALALTFALSVAWTWKDWADLEVLRLPDNDDVARLQQVRDWLNGQRFNDLMQYRSGLGAGAPMHWSRLADAGPALLLLVLKPLVGSHAAELVMAIAYPAILFFVYLLLVARIAVRLSDERSRVFAILLAAFAFPTISLFVPGRIDHHGLQIVLILVLLDAVLAPAGLRSGIIAGIATAASLAIGLETAPEIAAMMVVMGIGWLRGGRGSNHFASGFAASLGSVTLLLLAVAQPQVWPEAWCDGFTPNSTRATLIVAAGWALLGSAGAKLTTWRLRMAVGAALGAVTLFLVMGLAPTCFAGPYGALDPLLQKVWMRNVSEARGLFEQKTVGTVIGYGGLVLAGAVAAMIRARHDWRWLGFALFMVLGAIASILQVRVTYIMAGVAVIPFAVAIARQNLPVKRLPLWLCGAGMLWNLLAVQIDTAQAGPVVLAKKAQNDCTAPGPIHAIAALPRGRIMAPLELDSYLLSMTPHHVIASLYHRNNSGDLAMYRFFLSVPERAHAQARAERVAYVALCPESLQEDGLAPLRPGTLVARLQSPQPPPEWLEPVSVGGAVRVYKVR
ncbi:hypothetical protein [Sphingomonas xinjiangensis]|uniref:AcrB/AcrD/AcrF family protein n=1 Tax=Sphingomonas xinjiangensis TaxID=643568 RepID=A0A840YRI2_9SPHN|nr:hypothetical protein [Sphingomonas xinjiangensis]MBB5712222.1 hypothetical protein [Sphingomonas xinjiangensis]